MPTKWGSSHLQNILLGLILTSPSILSRFESIAYSYGRGFASNQLISLATSLKGEKDPISKFARLISKLSPSVRAAVTEHSLQKNMLERYAFAFQERLLAPRTKKQTATTSLKTADLEVCHARIRLALALSDAGALTLQQCEQVLEAELSFKKMYRFQQLFSNGRIRIDWGYLESEILDAIITDFGFFFKLQAQTLADKITGHLAEAVAGIVAARVSEIVLFESVTSFEGTLSNNLRHGIVVPRFLRAFLDSISSHSCKVPTTTLNRSWYQSVCPSSAERLHALEENVTAIITEFQEHWLRVTRDGEFNRSLNAETASLITNRMVQRVNFDPEIVAPAIIYIHQRMIANALERARSALMTETRSAVLAEVGRANTDLRLISEAAAKEFIDNVSINLDSAFEEVAGWLGLVDYEQSKSENFELAALIDEEAFTFGTSDSLRGGVKYEFFERRDGRRRRVRSVRLQGSAFDLFDQIIHNSITNARKRSGLNNETKILLRFVREGDDLVIWVGNNFARGATEEMRHHQLRAKNLVKKLIARSIRKGTNSSMVEGGSGFSKVVAASRKVLGLPPSFNFPPIAGDDGQFIVEIKLVGAASKVIYGKANSDS